MRQQIDCAVLVLAAHQQWMPKVLKDAEPALSRIRMHPLEWEAGHHLETDPNQPVSLPIETIAQSAVGLRRYDLALLPVSMETLAWTRQALGMIPRGPFIPIMGILKDMRSAAIQDLLELGMCDFVRMPICPEELRARMLSTVTTVPRPGSLREPEPGYGQASWLARPGLSVPNTPFAGISASNVPLKGVKARSVTPRRATSAKRSGVSVKHARIDTLKVIHGHVTAFSETTGHSASQPMSFKAAKAAVVEQFERRYISEALERNEGNIAMAARFSEKHRRAFWALMRKYEIDAVEFRQESPEG